METRTVTATIAIHIGDEPPRDLRLTYRASDPYAVTADFGPQPNDPTGEPIVWDFSRELMLSALAGRGARYGSFDLAMRLDADELHVELSNNDGGLEFWTYAEPVAHFLDLTTAVVRPGDEYQHLDVDAVVRRLLDGVR